MDKLIDQAYAVSIGLNTLITSLIFAPWVLPRETFSGFIGRQADSGSKIAQRIEQIVNRLCFWEAEHCWLTAWQERRARECFRA